jgi:iron complex outermembrane receptor protein
VLPLAVVATLLAAPAAWAQFPPEVRGRVVAADGRPLAGARVEADGGGAPATTDADGGFVLRGLEPGERELRVRLLGYRPARATVMLENGRVARVTLALAPAPVALAPVRVRAAAADAAAGALVLDRAAVVAAMDGGAAELGALLDGRAGLTVGRRGGPGAPATLSVRGAAASQLLVLVDGAELNEPVTGEADLSTVPLGIVERVTVLRGAQAARWGARALAGVVLVETRRAGRPELALRLDAGGLGERAAALTAGARLPLGGDAAASGLVSAERRTVRGDFGYDVPAVRGGGRAVRRNADAATTSLLATATVARGAAEARLRGEAFDVERGMPGSYVQPSPAARQAQRRVGAALGLRLARGRWEWTADASAQTQRAAYRDPAPPFGAAYDDTARARSLVGGASVIAVLGSAALSAGAEARRTRFDASRVPGAPLTRHQAGAWAAARLWRDLAAPRPLRAELAAALRADRASSLDGTELSPRLTASLGTPALTARLSYGRAFSPPALGDQFFQEGVQVRPNPSLAPERVRGEVEAGVAVRERRVGAALVDVDLAAYRADVRGMILWFPDFRFVWSPVNHDVVRRGAELDARARLPWRALDVHVAASAVRVAYAGPVLAGQVAYRPAVTGAAGAAADVAGVRVALEGRWVGERRTARGSAVNALPPFAVADLRLTRSVTLGDWRAAAALGVENLLDEQADLLADYPRAGRRWTAGVRLRRGGAPHPES